MFARWSRSALTAMALAAIGCGNSRPAATIRIDPAASAIATAGTVSFDCLVSIERSGSLEVNNTRMASNWRVDEGALGGSLAEDPESRTVMIYTAPITAGTYHVTCASIEEPTATATATIAVVVHQDRGIVNEQ